MTRKKYEPEMDGHKQCMDCFETKNVTQFRIDRLVRTGRKSICKRCHSDATTRAMQAIKIDKNPSAYFTCNNCDKNFYKFKNVKSVYEPLTIWTECKFCQSTDIESCG